MTDEEAYRVMLALLATRSPQATVCPSEIARALAAASGGGWASQDWRGAMPIVHAVVDRLLTEGRVQLSWKGRALEARTGPYRIARRLQVNGPEVGRRPGHPVTPDGRYFLVRGRLWRASDPTLPEHRRQALVVDLMRARSAVAAARRKGDRDAEKKAHEAVDNVKHSLGERGPVWWTDGAPDLNRHMARTGPYAGWYAELTLERADRSSLPPDVRHSK